MRVRHPYPCKRMGNLLVCSIIHQISIKNVSIMSFFSLSLRQVVTFCSLSRNSFFSWFSSPSQNIMKPSFLSINFYFVNPLCLRSNASQYLIVSRFYLTLQNLFFCKLKLSRKPYCVMKPYCLSITPSTIYICDYVLVMTWNPHNLCSGTDNSIVKDGVRNVFPY